MTIIIVFSIGQVINFQKNISKRKMAGKCRFFFLSFEVHEYLG